MKYLNEEELASIEEQLNIKLPSHYKDFHLNNRALIQELRNSDSVPDDNSMWVSTDVGNVREILSDVNHTRVVLDGSVQNLFEASCELLDSKDEIIDTRSQIKKQNLDIESKARELVEIYKKIAIKCK